MEIHLISDLHLDTRPQWDDAWRSQIDNIIPESPSKNAILVIAGDLASYIHPKYRDYLSALTERYANTVYVPGNHEFYETSGSVYETCGFMDRTCALLNTNVTCLHTGSEFHYYDVPRTNTRIIGATLWTNIPDILIGAGVENILNDYRFIPGSSDKGKLLPQDVIEMHKLDKMWLTQELERSNSKDVIVVTHHCPDRRLSLYNDFRSVEGLGPLYYASDMDKIMSHPNICAWCYGHTHESHGIKLPDYKYNFVINAYGYAGEKTGFSIGSGFKIKQ